MCQNVKKSDFWNDGCFCGIFSFYFAFRISILAPKGRHLSALIGRWRSKIYCIDVGSVKCQLTDVKK
jgi:hypothetical protein